MVYLRGISLAEWRGLRKEWRRVFDRKRGIKTVIGRGDLVFGESREMLKE